MFSTTTVKKLKSEITIYLINVERGQADQILGGLLAFRRVVKSGRPEDEVELLPRFLVVRLQPDEAVDFRGSNSAGAEELLDELLPRVVLHRVTPLRRARAQQVKLWSSKDVEFFRSFNKPVMKNEMKW